MCSSPNPPQLTPVQSTSRPLVNCTPEVVTWSPFTRDMVHNQRRTNSQCTTPVSRHLLLGNKTTTTPGTFPGGTATQAIPTDSGQGKTSLLT